MAAQLYNSLKNTHEFVYPVQANEVFLRLAEDKIVELQTIGFEFHVWPGSTDIIRLVFSHSTRPQDVESLIKALEN